MQIQRMKEYPETDNSSRTAPGKKKAGRFIKWLKRLLTVALVLAALILIALSPLFNLKTFEVKGQNHYQQNYIEGISGIALGENGFKSLSRSPAAMLIFRFGKAEKLIKKQCPYIKEVKVNFVLPSKVLINLKERAAAAIVSYSGTSIIIDKEGYILESDSATKQPGLPLIRGITFNNSEPGSKLKLENNEPLETAMNIIDKIIESDTEDTLKLLAITDYIDLSITGKVTISLDNRIKVKLGDLKELNYKLNTVKTIFFKSMKQDDKGVLDFEAGANPVFTPDWSN